MQLPVGIRLTVIRGYIPTLSVDEALGQVPFKQ